MTAYEKEEFNYWIHSYEDFLGFLKKNTENLSAVEQHLLAQNMKKIFRQNFLHIQDNILWKNSMKNIQLPL